MLTLVTPTFHFFSFEKNKEKFAHPTLPFGLVLTPTFQFFSFQKKKEKAIVRLFPDGWLDFLGSNKTNVEGNNGHNLKDFFFTFDKNLWSF